MNHTERPPEPLINPVDMPAALQAVGFSIGPVDNNRRLVPLGPATEGVLEFYSSYTATRLLALPDGGEDSSFHTIMTRYGMPVLPRYGGDSPPNVDLLLVPLGTWPLGLRLHLMKRNLSTYSGLLYEVARSQRVQYDNGLGVIAPAEGSRLLDHFAFVPDLRTETGQRLYIVPPYTVDHDAPPQAVAHQLAFELEASGEFTKEQIGQLATIMHGAVGNGGA